MKADCMQVELAFRKFDLDRDGFLSWDEFRQVAFHTLMMCIFDFSYSDELHI